MPRTSAWRHVKLWASCIGCAGMYGFALYELWGAATRHIVHGRHAEYTWEQQPVAFVAVVLINLVLALLGTGVIALVLIRPRPSSSEKLDRSLKQRSLLDTARREPLERPGPDPAGNSRRAPGVRLDT